MIGSVTRAQLLSRGVRNGAALLLSGAAYAQITENAAADPLPLGDLAYARLLVGVELLAADFYGQAIAASNTSASVTRYLKRASLNEQEHYESVAGIISGAYATPAVAGDFTFSYPAGTFSSQESIVKFAQTLEATMLGTYLGAIAAVQTVSLHTGLAQIAASEAQHSSYFSTLTGGRPFNLSFPPALTINQASDALDAYTA